MKKLVLAIICFATLAFCGSSWADVAGDVRAGVSLSRVISNGLAAGSSIETIVTQAIDAGADPVAVVTAAIAAKPGITSDMISSFLLMPHSTMPNLPLTRKDARDIAAFIMEMKK